MKRSTPVAVWACVLGSGLGAAHADVVVEETLSIAGAGAMSMIDTSGRTVTTVSGDRARMDTEMQMKSRLVRMFARDAGDSSEIIRLDLDRIYELDMKNRRYTETSLAEQRARLEEAMHQAGTGSRQPAPVPLEESKCEWSEPKVDVRKGSKSTIAGFEAEQYTVVATQSCTDRETGAVCDIQLSLDQWLAPGVAGIDELGKFHEAFAQRMGFDAGTAQDAARRAEAMFGRYREVWRQVAAKMQDAQGYPVKSDFALAFGGPQCRGAGEEAAGAPSGDDVGESVATGVGEAAGQRAAEQAGESALGGIAGRIGGRIAGSLLSRRKKNEPAEETAAATPAETAAPGMVTVLRIGSEVVSVKQGPVPATTFEVPAGFRKSGN